MVDVISQSEVFGQLNDDLIQCAFTEDFLMDDEHVSYDATHFEARDASKPPL